MFTHQIESLIESFKLIGPNGLTDEIIKELSHENGIEEFEVQKEYADFLRWFKAVNEMKSKRK